MKKKRSIIVWTILVVFGWTSAILANPASAPTKKANSFILNHLPFNDKLDFEEASRGHIDNGPGKVRGDDPKKEYVWNITEFNFLNAHSENDDFVDSVNPSLWRHAQLNHYHGLFKVTEGVYQVRGYDISNVTFIEGKTGYIVVDPLVSVETARASLELLFKHRGKKAIKAIIFSHPHVDHYGGVKGILSEEEIKIQKVPIIASIGFLEHAVSENVFAGNAMSRRAKYMFGHLLPKGPEGHVDSGVGQALSWGDISLVAPTDIIDATGQTRVIDGVTLVFQYTPGTEAPTEMNFYIPQFRALFMAENCNGTLHNLYTLRGAQVRDGKGWSFFLHEAAKLYGHDTDVLFTSHNWPKWGSERIVTFIKKQADMYKFIHDQTLHFANKGYTMNEIAEIIKLPPELDLEWDNRGYYGTVSHNSKAVYQRYLGWFDGNPAHLNPLPPVEAAKKYVDFMGGADTVISKAREYYDQGDYRFVAEVLNHVVFADPNNKEAKELQAKTFEQLGYQSESGIWRNFYLTGARELRQGVQTMIAGTTASPDTIKAMPVPLFFDYMAIRLDGRKAAGKVMRFAWSFIDTNEKYLLSLENGVLNHWQYNSKEEMRGEGTLDASISLSRVTFDSILLKTVSIQNAANSGMVRIDGDGRKLDEFMSMLDEFDPNFNIVTP